MNANDIIQQHFADSQQALSDSLEKLDSTIAIAARKLANTFDSDGKILLCGNGGSAADAVHFSGELLNKFVMVRRPLPAIALNTDAPTLTSIANDFAFEYIYSKQVEALAKPQDILVVFTTSGQSKNICRAIEAAQNLNVTTIAFTGNNGGDVAKMLDPNDIEIRVPNTITARIQEVHGLIIHCLCDLIDQQLFGELT